MAIKNTKLGGTDWADGQVLYAADQNDTFDALYAQRQVKIGTIMCPDTYTTSTSWVTAQTDDLSSYKVTAVEINYGLSMYSATGTTTGFWKIVATLSDTSEVDIVDVEYINNSNKYYAGLESYNAPSGKTITKIEYKYKVTGTVTVAYSSYLGSYEVGLWDSSSTHYPKYNRYYYTD